jgi:hypothetical protein
LRGLGCGARAEWNDVLSGAAYPPAGFYGLTIRLNEIIVDENEIIGDENEIMVDGIGEKLIDRSGPMQEKNCEISEPHHYKL